VNQNAPTGICCIKKFSGGYTPGPPHKGDKGREGIQEKQQGRDKKEVKGKNREGGNRKGGEGNDRGKQRGTVGGKGL
jgi:hypothetical protein